MTRLHLCQRILVVFLRRLCGVCRDDGILVFAATTGGHGQNVAFDVRPIARAAMASNEGHDGTEWTEGEKKIGVTCDFRI